MAEWGGGGRGRVSRSLFCPASGGARLASTVAGCVCSGAGEGRAPLDFCF
jgi:hypothetical protein